MRRFDIWRPGNGALPLMVPNRRGRTGVLLYDPGGTNISLSFKLEFPYSDNEDEYRALNIGPISTL